MRYTVFGESHGSAVGVVLEEQSDERDNASDPERNREFNFGLTALVEGLARARKTLGDV